MTHATGTVPRMTDKHFDEMVARWNHLRPSERREHVATCIAQGHDWREASFSVPESRTYVCRRCLRYDTADA